MNPTLHSVVTLLFYLIVFSAAIIVALFMFAVLRALLRPKDWRRTTWLSVRQGDKVRATYVIRPVITIVQELPLEGTNADGEYTLSVTGTVQRNTVLGIQFTDGRSITHESAAVLEVWR